MYFFVIEYILATGVGATLLPTALIKYTTESGLPNFTVNKLAPVDPSGYVEWAPNAISVRDYGPTLNIDFGIHFERADLAVPLSSLFHSAVASLQYEDGTSYDQVDLVATYPTAVVGASLEAFNCVRLVAPA